MKLKFIVALWAIAMGTASASELVASVERSKSGDSSVIGFDLISDGTVAGFNFTMELPGVSSRQIQSKNCVSVLPKAFSGSCSFSNGKLRVLAVSEQPGVVLPSGLVSVGSVSIKGMVPKGQSVKVVEFETSTDAGEAKVGSSKVSNL